MTQHRGPISEKYAGPDRPVDEQYVAPSAQKGDLVKIGPLMPPTHTVELVERHAVTVPMPPVYNTWSMPKDLVKRQQHEFARAVAWSACRRQANAWLAQHHLEAELYNFEQLSNLAGDEPCWGVTFTITVGKGASTQTFYAETPDAEVPEVDKWTWSARWRNWLTRFMSMDMCEDASRAKDAALRMGVAEVEALAEGIRDRSVISFGEVVARGKGLRQRPPVPGSILSDDPFVQCFDQDSDD